MYKLKNDKYHHITIMEKVCTEKKEKKKRTLNNTIFRTKLRQITIYKCHLCPFTLNSIDAASKFSPTTAGLRHSG